MEKGKEGEERKEWKEEKEEEGGEGGGCGGEERNKCTLLPRYTFLDYTAQIVWIFSQEQLHGTSS